MGLRSKAGKAATVVAATAVTGPIGGAVVAAGWIAHKIVKQSGAKEAQQAYDQPIGSQSYRPFYGQPMAGQPSRPSYGQPTGGQPYRSPYISPSDQQPSFVNPHYSQSSYRQTSYSEPSPDSYKQSSSSEVRTYRDTLVSRADPGNQYSLDDLFEWDAGHR